MTKVRKPSIGDKVFFHSGLSERVGTVTGVSESQWGINWLVTMADGSVDSVRDYDGTAEERGEDFFVIRGGCRQIGSYLVC